MEHEHVGFDQGAYETLDRIARGGRHTLTLVRRRLAETMDALDAGDFRRALNVCAEAQQAIGPLATAQTYIAIADDAELVKAADLKPGMVIVDLGSVGEVDVRDCGAARCSGHVDIKIGEHEMSFGAEQELYVQAATC